MKDNNLAAHPHYHAISTALFSDCKSCERALEFGYSEERNQGLYLYILQTASGGVARGKFSVIH